MSTDTDELRIKGRSTTVEASTVQGKRIFSTGRWLRRAVVKDEDWVESAVVVDFPAFCHQLKASGLKADVLQMPARLGDPSAMPGVQIEVDNAAVIGTADFKGWWEALPQEARKSARRAHKRGVTIVDAVLDDDFARGIQAIYDETPIRQSRRFWHYGKDLATVKRENQTYAERAHFIGAYFEGRLIGFMKWVYVDDSARIMQILCMNAHQDKRPIIALIVKAAESCHLHGSKYLIYGKYHYGTKTDSSITEFKRRLGFEQLDFVRYHVPLTWRGRLALRLGVAQDIKSLLPKWLLDAFRETRSRWLRPNTNLASAPSVKP